MEPTEFFKTAEMLCGRQDEPDIRTSIGRSYYALFLYFREYLRSKGLTKTIKPERDVHTFVVECLSSSNISEATRASSYLRDLKQLREDADYRLSRTLSSSDAEDALARARKALKDYHESMTSEKEQEAIKNATAFAKLKDWL